MGANRSSNQDGEQVKPLKTAPIRKCIYCQKRAEKESLLRVVRSKEGAFVIDRSASGKLPGRGAYLCLNATCLAGARKKRALERAFSSQVPQELYDEMERELRE